MKIHIDRVQKDADVTIGSMSIDGDWEAWCLEDAVRPDGIKIFGETAIPAGTYTVDLTYSPRFKTTLPLLTNVKGFVGIRIHPGNFATDTEGCILVGMDRLGKSLGRSRLAFNALFPKLLKAQQQHEAITLEIS